MESVDMVLKFIIQTDDTESVSSFEQCTLMIGFIWLT